MRLQPFEHRAIGVVVHHLRLALEIFETRAFAVTRGQRFHERFDVAVPPLIGPGTGLTGKWPAAGLKVEREQSELPACAGRPREVCGSATRQAAMRRDKLEIRVDPKS